MAAVMAADAEGQDTAAAGTAVAMAAGVTDISLSGLASRDLPNQPGLRANVGTPGKCGAHDGALATKMLAVGLN